MDWKIYALIVFLWLELGITLIVMVKKQEGDKFGEQKVDYIAGFVFLGAAPFIAFIAGCLWLLNDIIFKPEKEDNT